MTKETISKLKILSAMFIFGTIGVFVRIISLPSDVISLARGTIGAVFLGAVMLGSGKRINFKSIKNNILLLFVSGFFLGANWILLFEAYRFTTVATATLCYYLGPVFVILLSPFVFKERLTIKKIICVALSFLGMVLISGVAENGLGHLEELKGIILGIGAAMLYAGTMIFNKKINNISVYDKTLTQLFVSAIVLLPYCLIVNRGVYIQFNAFNIIMLIFVGIVHTGLTYYLYFGSIEYVNMQTTAVLSYIDPVTAVVLSVAVLHEPISISALIGAFLIIGAALVSENGKKSD